MDWLSVPTPAIIGHRGASAEAPENTLAAFGLAAEQGANGIELDVRLSADGKVMVIHDATVARTTNGTGTVSEMTARELQSLDAGMDQPIPTLDDVFLSFGPTLLYNVELKEFGPRDRGLEAAVADRIAAYHLENQVVVSSFNPFSLRRARHHLSRTTLLGFLWHKKPARLLRLLIKAQADHPHFSLVDEKYMAWTHAKQIRVHVWTVDDPDEARRLTSLGVHALITNTPARIRDALGS